MKLTSFFQQFALSNGPPSRYSILALSTIA